MACSVNFSSECNLESKTTDKQKHSIISTMATPLGLFSSDTITTQSETKLVQRFPTLVTTLL